MEKENQNKGTKTADKKEANQPSTNQNEAITTSKFLLGSREVDKEKVAAFFKYNKHVDVLYFTDEETLFGFQSENDAINRQKAVDAEKSPIKVERKEITA